ncbi:caspase family protein [Sphingomonas sp.]|uniref:caspase family protein n=1 Tax=Sphingomonas sp. TaxID=28214 RepID=UPI003AFFE171
MRKSNSDNDDQSHPYTVCARVSAAPIVFLGDGHYVRWKEVKGVDSRNGCKVAEVPTATASGLSAALSDVVDQAFSNAEVVAAMKAAHELAVHAQSPATAPPTGVEVRPPVPAVSPDGPAPDAASVTDRTSARRWAVVVGISKYARANPAAGFADLAYADADALDVKSALVAHGWSPDHVDLLVNEQATKGNVELALDQWLTKAGPDDTVVLFWSGHGYPDPGNPERVYFACYDTDPITSPATGFRMDRVRQSLEEVHARNVVVLADSCHAGKIVTRGATRQVGIAPYVDDARERRTVPKGWVYLVGADSDRLAVEHSAWSHGAFTQCLLQGLNGQAAGFATGRAGGAVTVGDLRAFMNERMPDLTQRVLGVSERPTVATSSGDPDIWNLTLVDR